MLWCCKCSDLGVTRSCSRREPPAGCSSKDHFDARMLSTAVKRTKYNRLKVVLTLKRRLMTQPGKAKRWWGPKAFSTAGGWNSPFICSDVGNWPTTCCLKYWDGSACQSCCILQTRWMRRRRLRHDTVRACSSPLSQFCKHSFTNHLLWLCYLNEQYLRGEWDAGQPR